MSTAKKLHAVWRGSLEFGALNCPVALYSAATTEERISFRTLNRATGNPVKRIYVDTETGKPVDREDQVRGYESSPGHFIMLTPEDISSAVPVSDKTLRLLAFIRCSDVDTLFLDKPYFVAPGDQSAEEAYELICVGLEDTKCAALVQSVLFRRVRSLLIYVHDGALQAATLNYDYEVVPGDDAFAELRDLRIKGEMLDLAEHIIETKEGEFEPADFEDRYDAALAELVKAKIEGREIKIRPPVEPSNVVDLLAALRESAGKSAPSGRSRPKGHASKKPARRRKAG